MTTTPLRVVGPDTNGPVPLDDPASFRIEGCTPGGAVLVRATFGLQGTTFRSQAEYIAGPDGVVDASTTPSTGGTYEGVDPLGLYWSADPTGPSSTPPLDRVSVEVSATDLAGGAEAMATIERHWLVNGATVEEVDDDEVGVYGLFARPGGDGPFPAVVAFGGSGGGLGPAATWAPLLASRGFAVLAVSYFRWPKLPDDLLEIEVEVVERAITWLRARTDIGATSRPVVLGQSRGSELALLAAVTWPDRIAAAIVFSASALVWSALGQGGPVDRPAWTLRGEPVPYVPHGAMPPPNPDGSALELTPLYLDLLQNDAMSASIIPVERFDGPILAVSGDDDAMWPSAVLTGIAEERAQQQGRRFVHLRYPRAGHTAPGPPGVPVFVAAHHGLVDRQMAFGGTRAGVAAARADSWPKVVAFLDEVLGSSSAR